MSVFTSDREKRLWLYTFLVLVAIISTLIFGGGLVPTMGQDLQGALFFYTMIAIAATVILHGLVTRPGKAEIIIWLGLSAVYIMLYARLGFAERSHLFEYSVLAIFIYEALKERVSQGGRVPYPALIALLATVLIGVVDETMQLVIPNRVFDPVDILFNSFVALMAIGSSMVLAWTRRLVSKFRKINKRATDRKTVITVEDHKHRLGKLLIGYAVLEVILFFVGLDMLTVALTSIIDEAEILFAANVLKNTIKAMVIFFATVAVIAGIGLINKKRWGLIPALIVGIISLPVFPIGTALGVYVIVVFFMENNLSTENQRNSQKLTDII